MIPDQSVAASAPNAWTLNIDRAENLFSALREDAFAASSRRNRLSVLLSRTNRVAYLPGQLALVPR